MKLCGRALIFGDANTVAQYRDNPKFSVHGPGFSKILIGEDEIENWREYIDLIAGSIADNGGRSCINASAVVVPKYARGNRRRARAEARPGRADCRRTTKTRGSRGFANPKMAEFIDTAIEDGLADARRRGRDREVSQRPAQGGVRRRRLSAPDHRALRLLRASAGEPRIPLPLRQRRRGAADARCSRRSAPRSS